MSYQINLSEVDDYLKVTLKGELEAGNEVNETIKLWTEVSDKIHNTKKVKMLAYWDIKGRIPLLGIFKIAADAKKIFNWAPGIKTSIILNEEGQAIWSAMKFAERIAGEKGYNFKAFEDEKTAIDWLKSV